MLGRKLGTHTCAENVDNTPAMILMDTILTSQNVNTWFVIAYQKLNKREQTYQKNIFMKTLQLKHPQNELATGVNMIFPQHDHHHQHE